MKRFLYITGLLWSTWMASACKPPPSEPTECVPIEDRSVALDVLVRWKDGRACVGTQWCFENPLPHQLDHRSVSGTDPQNVWAVGDLGVTMHFDGTRWASEEMPVGNALNAIWAHSAQEVWAAGAGGVLLHRTGTGWERVASPTDASLSGLWGFDSKDIWAVGERGTLLHWNGCRWVLLASPADEDLLGVWGSAPNDVWIIGKKGRAFHYDGTQWAESVIAGRYLLKSISGSGPNDVWILGESAEPVSEVGRLSALYRWDGSAWSQVISLPYPSYMGLAYSVRVEQPGVVWVSTSEYLVRGDGTTFSFVGRGTSPADLWFADDGTGWGVGVNGSIQRWDGSNFSQQLPVGLAVELDDIWAGEGAAWAVDTQGKLLNRQQDGTWSLVDAGAQGPLIGVWGSSPSDVWVVGDGTQLLHWNGLSWLASQTGINGQLSTLHGSARDNVWAGGRETLPDRSSVPLLLRFDGAKWSRVSIPDGASSILKVAVASSDSTWVVDAQGRLLRWDGTQFIQQTPPLAPGGYVSEVWAASADEIWLEGLQLLENGSIDKNYLIRWESGTWTPFAIERIGVYPILSRDLVRASPTDVWAVVGEKEVLLHFDGTRWSKTPVGVVLNAISGSDPGLLLAVGAGGVILRYSP